MKPMSLVRGAAALALVALVTGCASHKGTLEPIPPNTDPIVFSDGFGAAVDFQAFATSKLDAVAIDETEHYAGSASLRITVPPVNDPSGFFAGGAFTTRRIRDLSGYNALTFWAKASRSVTLDVAGIGNDNTGTSRYEAKRNAITISTTWQQFTIAIPYAARLTREGGLFFFAEGPEAGQGCTIWFDEVQYVLSTGISNPRPSFPPTTVSLDVGSLVIPANTRVTYSVNGVDQTIDAAPRYFDFVSSDTTVAKVVDGLVRVVGVGTANITASLGGVPAFGQVGLTATAAPGTASPVPTLPAADVISLFSDAYPNVTVDKWSADWDAADVSDVMVGGNATKKYSNLSFAGIEFISRTIDATNMTHLHLDVWAANGTLFRVKLVDFGADGAFAGGDDKEFELGFNAATTPAFTTGSWVSLDLPLSSFTGLTTKAHLAQIVLSGNVPTLYLDNLYLHR